ncbi:MAG TPA: hypothetical protein VN696_13075 [Pyrinomonadaceae bacterium]|nr:hypothetical protein [Pyrinomonadaceae bacterium]
MKKKAAITVETERRLVISSTSLHLRAWCQQCGAQTDMVTVNEATAIAGVSERQIFQLSESGVIHFTETEDGKTLFCVASLLGISEPPAVAGGLIHGVTKMPGRQD